MQTALTAVFGFAAFLLVQHAAAKPSSPPGMTITVNERGESRMQDDGR